MAEDEITALGGVSSNVAQGPNCLLPHLFRLAREKFNEDWYGSMLHDDPSVVGSAASNVGEGPSCLKLRYGHIRIIKNQAHDKLDTLPEAEGCRST